MLANRRLALLLTVVSSLMGTLPLARSATVTATNFNGPLSSLLSRDDGSYLTSGIVWLGSFSVDNASIIDAVSRGDLDFVQDQFTQFGRATSVFFNGIPGLYQDAITQTVEEGDAFDGQSIYTVISNQGMLRHADDLLIFEHGQVFLPDPERIEPALLDIEGGDLLVGDYDRYRATLGPIYDEPMFTLARVIPEPTTAGLVLLAGAWFLGRRGRRSGDLPCRSVDGIPGHRMPTVTGRHPRGG